jgi:Fic family protein
MIWNWQKRSWPRFTFKSPLLAGAESRFLHQSGVFLGALKHVSSEDKNILLVDLISNEALKTSAIEGQILNRDSLQSSIRRNFGLDTRNQKIPLAEQGIAEMTVDLYKTFADSLSRKQLFAWHRMLMKGRRDLRDLGRYRAHADPMQVVSGPVHKPRVHFEAPPTTAVPDEMSRFVKWFNDTAPGGQSSLPALTRAGIAHLYFVSIHPFEDGNGRIGRAIAEKALSQCLGQPTLVALSHVIEAHKKKYYGNLEKNNKGCEVTDWLLYFSNTVLEAQSYTQRWIDFLIEKSKLYDKLHGKLNERQEKVIARLFREGPEGFQGGLSAEKYIRITKTSRATATRDLQDLVEKGAVIKTGELKYTRYCLAVADSERHFGR